MRNSQETAIVNLALNNLKAITGINSEWTFLEHARDKGIDGILSIKLGERQIKFDTDIKKEVRSTQLDRIIAQHTKNEMFLLLAQNISPQIKEKLRKENIAYLDIAGNFYFRNERNYIFIEGNKIPALDKEKPNRAFTPTGLKIVFLLLTEKDALDMGYREIAHRANVALGNVPLVMNGLKDAGYVIAKNKNRYILTRKRELLDRWIIGYGETLRPKLVLGRYRFLERDRYWKAYQPVLGDVWGGEAGANLITNYIEPEMKLLYTALPKMELIKNMKLVPDAKGDIEIMQHFWQAPDDLNINHAPPLLIYADLILSQDARNAEVAELVFDNYLKPEFY